MVSGSMTRKLFKRRISKAPNIYEKPWSRDLLPSSMISGSRVTWISLLLPLELKRTYP